jgi:hypothetical protein
MAQRLVAKHLSGSRVRGHIHFLAQLQNLFRSAVRNSLRAWAIPIGFNRVLLALFSSRGGWQQVLILSQAPN